MKKYLLYTLVAMASLTSCDMNETPYGSLDDSTAIQTVNDAMRYRNGFYTGFRGIFSGSYITRPELQADMFNGITINGNRNGTFANGIFNSSDGDIDSFWQGYYTRIANVNYFIPKAEALLPQYEEDADKTADLNRYIAEAHFARALNYYVLFDRFCQSYSSDKGDTEGLGLAITTEYNPTADRSKYPARSTLNESVKFINDELGLAYSGLKAYETASGATLKPMAAYLNSLTVAALQARFALLIGDYDTAITKANEVINSRIYTLANVDNYSAMWTDDTSAEIIFMPVASNTEQAGLNATGGAWISIYDNKADYIPSFDALWMYDDGDVRFDAFFEIRKLNVDGANYNCYNFVKFPGNPALQTNPPTVNLMNMPKAFRLSEQYLILAEASAMKGGAGEQAANTALKTLRANRIEDYEAEDYSGQVLINQIREERTKELIGEGFRISDLRRWKQGFSRENNYPDSWGLTPILLPVGLAVTYTADDYRYTWPIPSGELDVNPNMAAQINGGQNPGY